MGVLWLMIAVDLEREEGALRADDADELTLLVGTAAQAEAVRELRRATLRACRGVLALDLVVDRATLTGTCLRLLLLRNCHDTLYFTVRSGLLLTGTLKISLESGEFFPPRVDRVVCRELFAQQCRESIVATLFAAYRRGVKL